MNLEKTDTVTRVTLSRRNIEHLIRLLDNGAGATHKFYSNWLKNQCLTDFRTHTEARETYNLAKSYFVA